MLESQGHPDGIWMEKKKKRDQFFLIPLDFFLIPTIIPITNHNKMLTERIYTTKFTRLKNKRRPILRIKNNLMIYFKTCNNNMLI